MLKESNKWMDKFTGTDRDGNIKNNCMQFIPSEEKCLNVTCRQLCCIFRRPHIFDITRSPAQLTVHASSLLPSSVSLSLFQDQPPHSLARLPLLGLLTVYSRALHRLATFGASPAPLLLFTSPPISLVKALSFEHQSL